MTQTLKRLRIQSWTFIQQPNCFQTSCSSPGPNPSAGGHRTASGKHRRAPSARCARGGGRLGSSLPGGCFLIKAQRAGIYHQLSTHPLHITSGFLQALTQVVVLPRSQAVPGSARLSRGGLLLAWERTRSSSLLLCN